MKVIVGLGNPGKSYEHNRHNVGFLAVDYLVELYKISEKFYEKFNSSVVESRVDDQKVLFAKPLTFMNESGIAVQEMVHFYKLNVATDIIVLHDEVDLPFGTVRATSSSSSAGQNGVQNIIDQLGT